MAVQIRLTEFHKTHKKVIIKGKLNGQRQQQVNTGEKKIKNTLLDHVWSSITAFSWQILLSL